ncbi:hypothetical protein [uncultured Campylobacter sp.]|uniref:hypothetical protein n=1 Tax=uncultured Campylobacter sp. TaxID=218934 RepID=UPI00261E3302|nr:hypothetical protein [uncultured Campylobacter sp.]
MAYFDIRYLREPSINRGAALGQGVAAIGDSLTKLGELGHAREKFDSDLARQARAEKMDADKFNYQRFKDERGYELDKKKLDHAILNDDRDFDLNRRKFDRSVFENDRTYGLAAARFNAELTEQGRKRAKEESEAAAKVQQTADNVAYLRKLYPKETAGYTDEELGKWGNNLEKNFKENKVDIFKKNIPVDSKFVEQYGDSGHVSWDDKGNYYADPWLMEKVNIDKQREARQMDELGDPQNRRENIKALMNQGVNLTDAKAKVDQAIEWKRKNPNAKFNSSLDSDMDDGAN